ncbi:histidine kinase [Akkermansiaceae bacterium]|nr:histidine kinase [Akkermansiaceae bacterium]MDB4407129.1 histidine kinase [bacterium]MDA8975813.1 histidine kinase [Akkermansiaceae bacterium]MDB4294242.1 histidine kinase [Akkermansiaceae bacterium]MDB4295850.1 histidine kinase [Akkermansiaceae bacterium]
MLKPIAKLLFGILIFPMVVEGQPVEASVPTRIEQSADENSLSSPTFRVLPLSARFRYRLEGLDSAWKEQPEQMSFVIRFMGEGRVLVERAAFPVTGESKGWNHGEAPPEFISRREEVIVPSNTKLAQITFSSSGPPQAVGVYQVRDVRLSTVEDPIDGSSAKKGSSTKVLLHTWNKSGTRPGMALRDSKFPSVLKIVDADIHTHADWASLPFPITGKKLIIEWSEAYSIGAGGLRNVSYERIPPGRYRFEVEELTIEGLPTGKITSLEFEVPRPLWKKWWFWFLCALAIALVIYLFIRSAVRKKVRRAIRYAQIIENERLRIAMDLHDDIGTRLSQISLIGTHAQSKSPDPETKDSLQKISSLTSELVGSLSETVWMLSPKNNDLESLIVFLCRLSSELCRNTNIRCRIDADPVDEYIPITKEFRHHIVLSVKESLNNALKHSQCSEILLKIRVEERMVFIAVIDNGKGFTPSTQIDGNGLASLKRRMQELKGTLDISQPKSGGTQILMKAPLKQKQY